jgi:hypothetical protein
VAAGRMETRTTKPNGGMDMNMKNITKTGLNGFVNQKIEGSKKDLLEKIELAINTTIDPILSVFVDVKKVENHASKFIDEVNNIMEKHEFVLKSWEYRRTIQEMNSNFMSLGIKIKEKMKEEITRTIEKTTDAYDFGNESINEAVKALQEQMRPHYKAISNLKTLSIELERAIKNESSASRAYKSLIALGVDMKDYEEAESYLPAIIKLSVDVCMINGNCEEISA